MALFEKSKAFPGYIRVRNVNRNELSRLVVDAIGPGRTQKKFSEEINVNPSTISRLVRKEYKAAPTEELIEKIVENADPQSGVTVERILDAYGYGKESDYKHFIHQNSQDTYDLPDGEEMKVLLLDEEFYPMLQSIIGELVMSGPYNVQHAGSKLASPLQYGDNLRLLVYDFYTDALSDLDIRQWSFYLVVWCNDEAEAMMPIFQEAYSHICNRNEGRKAYSLVTYDRKLFEGLKEEYRDMLVPDYISILLMDQEHGDTLDEFVFQQEDPKHQKLIFTSLPVLDEDPEEQGYAPASYAEAVFRSYRGNESLKTYPFYEVTHPNRSDRLERAHQKQDNDPDDGG